jgi:hypothetical protein
VTAAEQRHHDAADDRVLADDGLADLDAEPAEREASLVRIGGH